MALTISVQNNTVMGNRRVVSGTVTFDNSYSKTTGEPFSPADVGLDRIDYIELSSGDYNFKWNGSHIMVYGFIDTSAALDTDPEAAVPVADASDLSMVSADFRAVGH